jgi:hypothetical protein
MCENTVVKYVPRGYDYREVEYRCGSTGIDGNPVWCHSCEDSDRVRRIMDDSDADNAWLRSAGWGEM